MARSSGAADDGRRDASRRLDGRALPLRLLLGFLAVAAGLVLALGSTSFVVIESELRRQLSARADQGESATATLWRARASEVQALVELAAGRPTLARLMADGPESELQSYLDDLRADAGLDGLVVRDEASVLRARSPRDAREPIDRSAGIGPVEEGPRPEPAGDRIAMALAGWAPVGPNGNPGGSVHGWIDLDEGFLAALARDTGVLHSLYLDGRPVTWLASRPPDGLDGRTGSVRLPEGDRYVRTVALPSVQGRLSDVLLLPLDALADARRRVATLVGASAAGALALATLLAYGLARRVTAPVRELVRATERIGRGDLEAPVAVHGNVREIRDLARSVESMRRRLRGARDELHAAKEWSDGLVASIAEGIVTLDDEGRITSWSAGAERVLGWRAGEAIGRSWAAVLGEGDASANDPGEGPAAFLHPTPGTQARRTATRKDGATITLAVSSGTAIPAHGSPREHAYVVRDVTEEERAVRQREYLLASLSHEFRTPLAALRAGAEILRSAPREEDARELVRSMLVSTLRLEELVDNLLGSASLQAGRFQVRPRRMSLDDVIEEVLLVTAPVLAARSQRLEMRGEHPAPDVLGDPRRVSQVLVNLISNASRHAPSGRPIVVAVHGEGDFVRVDVVDEGPGISDDIRPDLFKPFAQGARAELGGVGLGLSIVQAIVERHGGTVGAHDAPGGGARFSFTLPRFGA